MRIIHFDTSGWHARFDDGFDDDNVVRVADALASVWAAARPGARVLVGYGVRRHAARHAELAGVVMAGHGLDVVVTEEPTPIPAVAWSAAHDPACVGAVVLTASERPSEWGGLLVRGADGGPADASFLAATERAIDGVVPAGRGPVSHASLIDAYERALCALVDVSAIASAAPLVVADPLHGAASHVLASLLRSAGARVVSLHDEADATFAGLRPEPVEPWIDGCEQRVGAEGAACGVALDEDGDRAALVDERGRFVGPHDLVPLMLGHLVRRGSSPTQRRVVTTLASSARVRRRAERLGFEVTTVPVGFGRLYDEVLEGDVLLAAEEYGGLCLPWHLYERDGLLVCLLALEMLALEGRPLSALVGDLRREIGHMDYGRRDVRLDAAQIQALRNVLPGLNPSRIAGRTPVAVSHTDGLHLRFDDDSWVMLRPARTQAVVRAYAEAPSLEQRDELLRAACELALLQL